MLLPVHFHPEQDPCTSAVVADWIGRHHLLQLHGGAAATPAQLARAHDGEHLTAALAQTGAAAQTVAAARDGVGALIGAGHAVCGRRHAVACAVAGPAHLAGWNFAPPQAPFNGLVVAALDLLQQGRARRVAILDLSLDYAAGTVDILQRLGRSDIAHYSAGAHWRTAAAAPRFLGELPRIVRGLLADAGMGTDVLLVQASVDTALEAGAGGWLTAAQLRERDALVFTRALELGVPVVWSLGAGDASATALAARRATFEEAQAALARAR